MSKKQNIIWFVIILVLLIVGIVYVISKPKQASGPIILGFVAPLSGDAASYGETERNSTKLAVDEINSNGGINGRPISVVYEDGKCNGKDATSAAQKLINVDGVKIILGGMCSSETLAIAAVAEPARVLVLSAFSSSPKITTAGDYIFRSSPSDDDIAKVDANYIASKYKSVAIISENTDYSQGVRSIMKSIFQEKGVRVVSDEVYGGAGISSTDFHGIIQNIRIAKPDAIYINSQTGKAGGLIVKQINQLGLKIPLLGNYSLASTDAANVAGDLLEGMIVSDSTSLSDKGEKLLAKYKETFKTDPASNYEMGASYDRVYIFARAIAAVGDDTNEIKDYLYSMKNFDGAVGSYHFDKNGDVVGIGFSNYLIKDGKEVSITK